MKGLNHLYRRGNQKNVSLVVRGVGQNIQSTLSKSSPQKKY